MKKSPAFQFYPRDFISSTKVQLMELHEVGAYMFMLCHAWLNDPAAHLPADDEALRRLAHMTPEQWATSRERILACWHDLGDRP